MLKNPWNRLLAAVGAALVARADRIIACAQRTPHTHLPGYMLRFWLMRPRWWTLGCGLRVHNILRSDHDRHAHTHPWLACIGCIIKGPSYWEVIPCAATDPRAHYGGYVNLDEPFRIEQRQPGQIVFRSWRMRHKLYLFRGPVWTLMFTLPELGRGWGFFVPGRGLVDRREYHPRDFSGDQA